MHGAFNPNFNQMNGQNNNVQKPQQQPQPNNGGWVGFNNNAQTNQNPPQNAQQQPNGGGDFMTGQQAQKQSSMNSILGKYHSKPSNQFLTSLPGQQQPQPNMMGMNGMNRMGMNNNMNMMGMNGMNP